MADSKHEGQSACPVDHKSREAWLTQARAANVESESPSLPPSHPPVTTATTARSSEAESCPVDHKAREVWVQHARVAASAPAQSPPAAQSQQRPASGWTSYLARVPFFSRPSDPSSRQPPTANPLLGTEREVSTIPRTSVPSPFSPSSSTASGITDTDTTTTIPPRRPAANHEQETGADAASGNWIYPSEKMFFEAMRRKGHDPRTADMRTVVPIHNAVNERAWAEIKAWEAPWVQGTSCDGPRLHSFSGLSTHMSPRARVNTLLGYQAPFDRHDWVVDRCGKEIEYVIDFYAGRNPGSAAGGPGGGGDGGKLSFYLDVRPKLNTWEGVKMRALRAAGVT
ncbi:cytochrome c and c1 heme-lyase [Biscogniauxia marginata]|nr:cytochrome c and c1 heme-lyase [Biscogniauxia marginata]